MNSKGGNDNKDNKDKEVIKSVVPSKDLCQATLHKNSFLSVTSLPEMNIPITLPYPSDLPYESLLMKFPEDIMSGYEVKDNEGIFSLSTDLVQRQSGLVKDIVTKFAKCLVEGGAVMLSLPVRIFEPRILLERYSDWWAFAPILLKRAGTCNDIIEAFKHTICFSLSALFRSSEQLKPFNPLLGETYQAHWEDGTNVYLEHINHIPPITTFYITEPDNDFKLSGYFQTDVEGMLKSLITNKMTLIPKGKITVSLPMTKQTITYQVPRITLGGMVLGKRYVVFDGHMKFEDRDNGLKAVIFFNKSPHIKSKRVHDIYGQIFRYDYSTEEGREFYEDTPPKNPFPSDKKMVVSEITGSWLEEIKFDDISLWSIKDAIAPQVIPEKNVLPSDVRYREDRIWLDYSFKSKDDKDHLKLYEEYAQEWKLALEAQQRHNNLLRQRYKEKEMK